MTPSNPYCCTTPARETAAASRFAVVASIDLATSSLNPSAPWFTSSSSAFLPSSWACASWLSISAPGAVTAAPPGAMPMPWMAIMPTAAAPASWSAGSAQDGMNAVTTGWLGGALFGLGATARWESPCSPGGRATQPASERATATARAAPSMRETAGRRGGIRPSCALRLRSGGHQPAGAASTRMTLPHGSSTLTDRPSSCVSIP